MWAESQETKRAFELPTFSRAMAVDAQLKNEGERTEDDKKRLRSVSRKQREKQMRREVRLIRAWVKSLNISFAPGASQKDKQDHIKKEIRQRMLEAFKLPDK